MRSIERCDRASKRAASSMGPARCAALDLLNWIGGSWGNWSISRTVAAKASVCACRFRLSAPIRDDKIASNARSQGTPPDSDRPCGCRFLRCACRTKLRSGHARPTDYRAWRPHALSPRRRSHSRLGQPRLRRLLLAPHPRQQTWYAQGYPHLTGFAWYRFKVTLPSRPRPARPLGSRSSPRTFKSLPTAG